MSTIGDELVAQMIKDIYDDVQDIKAQLSTLEEAMTSAHSQLVELQTAMNDFRSDLFARLDALEAAQGKFTPEAQEIFNDLKSTVAAADVRVGDADGSDNPPVDPPVADPFSGLENKN